ncbi:MAG: hypothetical protein AVDCRST_MAG49-2893, partial [uncultured Thermomicrobiales bacterium]
DATSASGAGPTVAAAPPGRERRPRRWGKERPIARRRPTM